LIHLRDSWEIERIQKSSQIVRDTLEKLSEMVKPGISTLELDSIAEDYIKSQDAIPGFKGLYGFPSTVCASVDDEVVHGVPNKKKLEEGQILSLDVGAIYKGYYGDHARTFPVGSISSSTKKLLDVTEKSLYEGIKSAKPGNRIGDISYSIQDYVESNGFAVVRDLVGHGIGESLHEDPQIPNFGVKGTGDIIKEGMCFAIEPMVTMKSYEVFTKKDDWTICTKDGSLAAHFEHTVTINNNGAKILTK